MRKGWLFVFVVLAISSITPHAAFAQTTRPAQCFEDFDDMCGLLSGNPSTMFGAILTPLETQVVGFSLVILWGGLLGIVWLKTENIMLLGIIGVIVSATITGLSTNAQGIGMLLLGISIGVLLFQLIRQRVALFS